MGQVADARRVCPACDGIGWVRRPPLLPLPPWTALPVFVVGGTLLVPVLVQLLAVGISFFLGGFLPAPASPAETFRATWSAGAVSGAFAWAATVGSFAIIAGLQSLLHTWRPTSTIHVPRPLRRECASCAGSGQLAASGELG